MNPAILCESWDRDACNVSDVKFEKAGDYFVLTGTARARGDLGCVLPQLRLDVSFFDKDGNKLNLGILKDRYNLMNIDGDTIHLADRALEPGEEFPFKLEGLWDKRMHRVEVSTKPYIREKEK
ncbi:hypothetical protein JXM67_00980 [candidate division WOR-3 bacterium]|nr:hypothetical protein [candidate division WOR-3 bacterium]